MSSHHFVKDGQEPALIIANGESCSYEMLVGLMEWSPFIVVLDGAYKRVNELQIKPDVVIGDLDSVGSIGSIENVDLIQDSDQENTDLEKAINLLVEKKYTDINVVWATGKRLDHTLNNFHTLAKYSDINVVIYDNHSKAFALPKKFSKVYKKNSKISLIPLHTCTGISTENLVYSLNNEDLSIGGRSGTSNSVLEDGIVSVTYTSGTLILIESED